MAARLPILLSVAVIVVTGCSTLNEGQIDYRYGPLLANPGGAAVSALRDKYDRPQDDALLHRGDTISVHLVQGFIKGFSEATDRALETLTLGRVKVRGEIAVVAKVFEIGSGPTADYTLSTTKTGGRLVYYSGDVRPGGHFLNFSQLPIYGPIAYGGRALMLQLTVVEMDNAEAAQVKGMLKTLAGFGAAAYPPASPVLAVLDRLGDQLTKGDLDDTDFRYTFVLQPSVGSVAAGHPVLAQGNYILVKEEPFNGCSPFCHDAVAGLGFRVQDGRLQTADGKLYTDKTYFVMQINKGLDAVEMDVAQAFSDFERNLVQDTANATLDPTPLINEFTVAVRRSVTFSRANRMLGRAATTRSMDVAGSRELVRDTLELLKKDLDLPPERPRVLSEDQTLALVRRLRLMPGATAQGSMLTVDQVKATDVSTLLSYFGYAR